MDRRTYNPYPRSVMDNEEIQEAREFIARFVKSHDSDYLEVGRTALRNVAWVGLKSYQVMIKDREIYNLIGLEIPDRVLWCSTKTIPDFKMYSDLRMFIYPPDVECWPAKGSLSQSLQVLEWSKKYEPHLGVDKHAEGELRAYETFIKRPGATLELYRYWKSLVRFDWYYDYSDDGQLAMNRREDHHKLADEALKDPLKLEIYKEIISTISGAFDISGKVKKAETYNNKPG